MFLRSQFEHALQSCDEENIDACVNELMKRYSLFLKKQNYTRRFLRTLADLLEINTFVQSHTFQYAALKFWHNMFLKKYTSGHITFYDFFNFQQILDVDLRCADLECPICMKFDD